MALALAINRIFESSINWHSNRFLPFVLPAPDGLFLGAAEKLPYFNFGNRVSVSAFTEEAQQYFGSYVWQPSVEMRVHTFVGLRQLTKEQNRLKNVLLGFLSGRRKNALEKMFEFFGEIENQQFVIDFNDEEFLKTIDELYNLIKSPIWKSAVRLSKYHRDQNKVLGM